MITTAQILVRFAADPDRHWTAGTIALKHSDRSVMFNVACMCVDLGGVILDAGGAMGSIFIPVTAILQVEDWTGRELPK